MYLGDEPYEKDVNGARVTVRDPWRVGIFSLLTLGCYGIVWFYMVNAELDRYAKAHREPRVGGSPVLAVLGVTVGALLVLPAIATWFWMLARVRRAQHIEAVPTPLTTRHTLLAAAIGFVP